MRKLWMSSSLACLIGPDTRNPLAPPDFHVGYAISCSPHSTLACHMPAEPTLTTAALRRTQPAFEILYISPCVLNGFLKGRQAILCVILECCVFILECCVFRLRDAFPNNPIQRDDVIVYCYDDRYRRYENRCNNRCRRT